MENLGKLGLIELDQFEKINFEGGHFVNKPKAHNDGALLGVVAGVVGMTVIALTGAGAIALAGAAMWTAASAFSL
jgi:hypothetical protein